MIKKIFNGILKLPYLLLVIVLSGIIAWEGLSIISAYQKADSSKDKIEESSIGYNRLNDALMDYLIKVLGEYKNGGIAGVVMSYENLSRENGYRLFEVVIADGTGVFDSYSEEKGKNYGNYELNHNAALQFNMDSPTEVRIVRAIELYKCTSYGYKEYMLNSYLNEELAEFIKDIAPELTLRVCATSSGADYFYRDNDAYISLQKQFVDEELNIFISEAQYRLITYAVIYAIAWLLLVCKTKKMVNENDTRSGVEKFNTELMLLLAGASAIGIIYSVYYFAHTIYYTSNENISNIQIGVWAKIAIFAAVLSGMLAIYIKKLYRKCVIKDSILVKIGKYIIKVFKETYGSEKYGSDKDIKKRYVRKIWMDVIVTIIVFVTSYVCNVRDIAIMGFMLIAFYIYYIYHSIKEYKYLRLFNKVNLNIDYLYNGMYEYVDREDTSEIMMKLANLSMGFKQSVAKQIEAEKLQIELITNVSHDLKTPLTSIISYVDLLSKEELPAVASDYVKILVDKSDRLKSIVSDVFDLAKAASGEEIELESLDGIILVNQVLSDMEDAIKSSGREIKLKTDIETAPITGNGQKLYRVFQNVIGNALKYSMPGTRIFVNANMFGNEFVFTIKNVSEFEIDFTEEEILSRFVRGDKARHSEGNGLGLSIAKSFTEQCGGSFAVSLDDDMFKVIIKLK